VERWERSARELLEYKLVDMNVKRCIKIWDFFFSASSE
jgi:hypothetical protein